MNASIVTRSGGRGKGAATPDGNKKRAAIPRGRRGACDPYQLDSPTTRQKRKELEAAMVTAADSRNRNGSERKTAPLASLPGAASVADVAQNEESPAARTRSRLTAGGAAYVVGRESTNLQRTFGEEAAVAAVN